MHAGAGGWGACQVQPARGSSAGAQPARLLPSEAHPQELLCGSYKRARPTHSCLGVSCLVVALAGRAVGAPWAQVGLLQGSNNIVLSDKPPDAFPT